MIKQKSVCLSVCLSLQAVSYEIKKKYPLARRNVLFDDEAQDLVLDFCVEEGRPWKRMSSTLAKERRKKAPAKGGKTEVQEGEIDDLLDRSVTEDEDGHL